MSAICRARMRLQQMMITPCNRHLVFCQILYEIENWLITHDSHAIEGTTDVVEFVFPTFEENRWESFIQDVGYSCLIPTMNSGKSIKMIVDQLPFPPTWRFRTNGHKKSNNKSRNRIFKLFTFKKLFSPFASIK